MLGLLSVSSRTYESLPGREFSWISANQGHSKLFKEPEIPNAPLLKGLFTSRWHFSSFGRPTSPLFFLGYAKTLQKLWLFMGRVQTVTVSSAIFTWPDLITWKVAKIEKAKMADSSASFINDRKFYSIFSSFFSMSVLLEILSLEFAWFWPVFCPWDGVLPYHCFGVCMGFDADSSYDVFLFLFT